MSNRILIVALLSFWTLSVVSGPLFVYSFLGDDVEVRLSTGEEESGESLSVGELEEKLLTHTHKLFSPEVTPAEMTPTLAHGLVDFGLEHEIRLPPPEYLV